jgi:mannose/fructose/N-acetylgalactosamine-specific phosphotransferase system component IIC
MSKLKNFLVGASLAMLPFGFAATAVHAQTNIEPGDITGNLNDVQANSGLGNQDLEESLGMLISVLLGVLGIIFLVLVIWAGFLWMTAGGDDKKVGKAKGILVTAVIGLVILLSAYAISSFVLNQLIEATGSGA